MRRMVDEKNLLFKARAQAPLTLQEVINYLTKQTITVNAAPAPFDVWDDDPDITYFTDDADYENHTAKYPLYLSYGNNDFQVSGNLRLTLQFPDTINSDEALEEYVTEGSGRFTVIAIDEFEKEEDGSNITVRFGGWSASISNVNWQVIPNFKIGDTVTIPEQEEPYNCSIYGEVVDIDESDITTTAFGYLSDSQLPYAEFMRINQQLEVNAIETVPSKDEIDIFGDIDMNLNRIKYPVLAAPALVQYQNAHTESYNLGDYKLTTSGKLLTGRLAGFKVYFDSGETEQFSVVDAMLTIENMVYNVTLDRIYNVYYYDWDADEARIGTLHVYGNMCKEHPDRTASFTATLYDKDGNKISMTGAENTPKVKIEICMF